MLNTGLQLLLKPNPTLLSQCSALQNSVELTARVILVKKALADGLWAQVFPQYLANHKIDEGQNPDFVFIN
jgi:hypothetical protein